MAQADRIAITGIRCMGRHGANPGEKDEPQPFDVDVELAVDLAGPSVSDRLAETVDYDALHRRIVRIVGETSYDLLERIAADVAATCLEDPRVASARVSIAKPGRLHGATPRVTLVRAR
jgi:dihydroneopterin aldolase